MHRANVITVHSPEMREILLSKFGRELKSKVCYTLFPMHASFKLLEKNHLASMIPIEISSKIKNDTILITLGHNAHPMIQHIESLMQIIKIKSSLLKKCLIIIPWSYKNTGSDYYNRVLR